MRGRDLQTKELMVLLPRDCRTVSHRWFEGWNECSERSYDYYGGLEFSDRQHVMQFATDKESFMDWWLCDIKLADDEEVVEQRANLWYTRKVFLTNCRKFHTVDVGLQQELWRQAVMLDGMLLQWVPHKTQELCRLAVEQTPFAIQKVPRQTNELCLMALKRRPSLLPAVRCITLEMVMLVRQLLPDDVEELVGNRPIYDQWTEFFPYDMDEQGEKKLVAALRELDEAVREKGGRIAKPNYHQ